MRWTERQRAMLSEIGIRLWLPDMPEASEPLAPDSVQARPPVGATSGRAAQTVSAPAATAHATEPVHPAAIDAIDEWTALAAEAAACTACALCAGRTHSVFGSSPAQADWLIVGDAPEAEDDRAGEPFVGRAGRLLDNMLAAIHLTRYEAPAARRAYLTHTVKCRPPGQRSPEAGEVARCAPFLQRQVQLLRPRIVVAMGAVAAQGLVGSTEPLGRLRGRVHRFAGIPLVVTHHPAYLLRQPHHKAEAWDDLCLAAETLRHPPGT